MQLIIDKSNRKLLFNNHIITGISAQAIDWILFFQINKRKIHKDAIYNMFREYKPSNKPHAKHELASINSYICKINKEIIDYDMAITRNGDFFELIEITDDILWRNPQPIYHSHGIYVYKHNSGINFKSKEIRTAKLQSFLCKNELVRQKVFFDEYGNKHRLYDIEELKTFFRFYDKKEKVGLLLKKIMNNLSQLHIIEGETWK